MSPELVDKLRARARRLAQVEAVEDEARTEMLVVLAGGTRFGLPLGSIEALVPLPAIVRLPGAPASVAGVAPAFGRTLTVIDLAAVAGTTSGTLTAGVSIRLGPDAVCILGVESYEGVAPVPPLSSAAGVGEHSFVAGMGPDALLLLDVPALARHLNASFEADTELRP